MLRYRFFGLAGSSISASSRRLTRVSPVYVPSHGRLSAPQDFGAMRGLIHSSQSTQSNSGQLLLRARMQSSSTAQPGTIREACDVSNWPFLLSSLWRGAEGVSKCRTMSDKRRAQQLFIHEVQRRLSLLEDGLVHAALPQLLRWPSLFRVAAISLPLSDESQPTTAIPTGNTAATFHHRAELLTATVIEITNDMLASADASQKSDRQKRRLISAKKQWDADWCWHRSHVESTPLTLLSR